MVCHNSNKILKLFFKIDNNKKFIEYKILL